MALHSVSAACITSAASPSPSLHSSSSLHCSSSDVTASIAFLGQPWTSRPDRVSALCAFCKNLSRPRNDGSSRDDLSSRAAFSNCSSRHPSTALLPCPGGGLPGPQALLSTRASAAADAASAATLPEQQQQQPRRRQNQQTRGGEPGAVEGRQGAGQSRSDGGGGGGGGGGGATSRFNSRGRRGGESGANAGSFARGRGGGYSNGNGNDSPLATLTRVSSCLAALREAKQQWVEERRRRASQAKKKKAKNLLKSKEGAADQDSGGAGVDEPVAAAPAVGAAAAADADATDAVASAAASPAASPAGTPAASPAGTPAADGVADATSTPPETLESVVWPILDQSEREWAQSDVILVLKELGAQRDEHDLLGAVFTWLQHVEGTSKELEAGVRAYTTVLAAYGKAGNVEQMEAVARGMEARGVPPDLFTYNALIGGYARAGRWRAAIGVYKRVREDEMVEPDRVTCVEMAMMLAAAKQPIPLRAVLDDMLALRIPMDAKLLERAPLDSTMPPSFPLAQPLPPQPPPRLPPSPPTPLAFPLPPHPTLPPRPCASPWTPSCWSAHALRIPVDAKLLERAVPVLARGGEHAVVTALHRSLCQEGVKLPASLAVACINAYGALGMPQHAEGVFQTVARQQGRVEGRRLYVGLALRQQQGRVEDRRVFVGLLRAYASNGQMREAEGVVQDMLQGDVRPSTGCFLALLDGWVVGGEGAVGEWRGERGKVGESWGNWGRLREPGGGGGGGSAAGGRAALHWLLPRAAGRVGVAEKGGRKWVSLGKFFLEIAEGVPERLFSLRELQLMSSPCAYVLPLLPLTSFPPSLPSPILSLHFPPPSPNPHPTRPPLLLFQLHPSGRVRASRGSAGVHERAAAHTRPLTRLYPLGPLLPSFPPSPPRHFPLPSPPRSYTGLGEFGLAEGVLEYMRELQLTPDPTPRSPRVPFSPSHPSISHSPLSYTRLGEFGLAEGVLEYIRELQLTPDPSLHLALISALKGRCTDSLLNHFGFPLHFLSPSPSPPPLPSPLLLRLPSLPPLAPSPPLSYTGLGEFGLAEGVLEYMRELQLTPDPSLHLALISAYLSASHPAWAHSALCDLLAEHPAFQPPVEVVEGIMAGYLGGDGEGGVAEGGVAEGGVVEGKGEGGEGKGGAVSVVEEAEDAAGVKVAEESAKAVKAAGRTAEMAVGGESAPNGRAKGKTAATEVQVESAAVAGVEESTVAAVAAAKKSTVAVEKSTVAAEESAVETAVAAAVKVTDKAAAVKVTDKAVAVKVTEKAAAVKVTEKATAAEKMAKPAELTEKAAAVEVGGVLSSTEATEQTGEESLLQRLEKGLTVGEEQVVAELEAAGLVGGEESEEGTVGRVAAGGGGGPAAVMTLWKILRSLFASSSHVILPAPCLLSLSAALRFPLLPLHPFALSHLQSLQSIPTFQPTLAMFVPVIKNRALAGDFSSLCSIMADLRGLGLTPSDQVFAALRLAPLESAGAKKSAAVASMTVTEAPEEVASDGGGNKGEGGDGGGVKQGVSGKGKYRKSASGKKDEKGEEGVRGENREGKAAVVKREVEAGGKAEAVEQRVEAGLQEEKAEHAVQKERREIVEPMKVVAEEGKGQAEIVVSVGKFSVKGADETGKAKKRHDTKSDRKDRNGTEKTMQAEKLDVGAAEKHGVPGKEEACEGVGGHEDELASKVMETETEAGDAVKPPTTQETPSQEVLLYEGKREAMAAAALTEGTAVGKLELVNQGDVEVSTIPSAGAVAGDHDSAASSVSGRGGETRQEQDAQYMAAGFSEELMGGTSSGNEKAGKEKNARKRDLEKVGLGKGALANVKGFGAWSKATKKAGKGCGKTSGKGAGLTFQKKPL
ncbi:unnamed protein product [Closterium sp. Naga37s-1]|nr:unnamed protein product [Closterium sp. Naga37s-1]